MNRHFWVLAHRYAGLYMAFFLIVAGLTGSVLAFRYELEEWLNPEDYRVEVKNQPLLDPLVLRDRTLALEPKARVNVINLPAEPGMIYTAFCELPADPATGKEAEIKPIKLNPYTGERISDASTHNTNTGYWPLTRKNIIGFIFELHYSLLLNDFLGIDDFGFWLFGIAATIWTLDCFVGFYLTLPMRRKNSPSLVERALTPSPAGEGWRDDCRDAGGRATHGAVAEENKISCHPNLLLQGEVAVYSDTPGLKNEQRSFWQRWQVAWKIKWPSSTLRLNFDLHRAGGLWVWPMLLIFAWSSVMLNLRGEIYDPVMNLFFETNDSREQLPPDLPQPLLNPPVDFKAAYQIAGRLITEQAKIKGFTVFEGRMFAYNPAKGIYSYAVRTSRDPTDSSAGTCLFLNATTGAFVRLQLPTDKTQNLIDTWLFSLHMARIWGLPYKIFVCFLGLVITMLSITGVYLWLKKLQAARSKRLVELDKAQS